MNRNQDGAGDAPASQVTLPEGVEVRSLSAREDNRGSLTETFRSEWGFPPLAQLNLVRSKANVLRGVHVHPNHDDYLFVVSGQMMIGLHDLRPYSTTFGLSAMITLDAASADAVRIPGCVAHGFCFLEEVVFAYGLSAPWNAGEDIGCRWDDPKLGLDWPVVDPLLSERDRSAPSLAAMKAQLAGMTGGS